MKRLLMVLAAGRVRNHALPDRGAVTIGRSEDCVATIDDGSVSRHRARIDVANGELTVKDLPPEPDDRHRTC